MRVSQRLRFGHNTPEQQGRARARSDAFKLALIYGTLAGLWIAFSDRFVVSTGLPRDLSLFIGSLKGEGFVIVTSVILYSVAVRHLHRLYTSEERHARLFDHATEGLTLFRVVRDDEGEMTDLVIEDVNPTQSVRLNTPRAHVVGQRMSDSPSSERMRTYFDLVKQSVDTDSAVRGEYVVESGTVDELVTTYPIEPDLWAVSSMDITEMREAQEALRAKDEWIRDAYVDVLDAVTGGKLLLLSEDELERELGERISEVGEVHSPEEIGEARRAVGAALAERFPEVARSSALQNPLGEALNNVVKHAGSGQYAVYLRDARIQLWVADSGPGIDFRTLPKATLVAGFSTASTLGMGFTIMLQLCDRVMISTSPGRTIVVLEVATQPDESARHALELSATQ